MATNTENIVGVVQHRRGTSEEWKISTVVPYEGELVIEECEDGTCRCKIGDGKNPFEYLSYADAIAEAGVEALKTQIEINEQKIPAFYNEINNFTLVALKDSEGEIGYYLYDTENRTYSSYSEASLDSFKIYPLKIDKQFDETYTKTNVINEFSNLSYL